MDRRAQLRLHCGHSDRESGAVVASRPKQHQLETKSRWKFESAVPEEWVVRNQDRDYGIDSEVEVFEGGDPTGQVFKVQLKAVASLSGRKPSVKVPLSKLSYWQRLNFDVLLALYVEDEDRFFVRWASGHDTGLDADKKTTTVSFEQSDDLSQRITGLVDELALLAAMRQGKLTKLGVQVDVQLTDRAFAREVRRAVERHLRTSEDIIRTGDPGAAVLRVTGTQTSASLPLNFRSYTLHARAADHDAEQVAAHAILALAAVIPEAGALLPAAALIRSAWPCSCIQGVAELNMRLFDILLNAGEGEEGAGLLAALATDQPRLALDLINSVLLRTMGDHTLPRAILERIVQTAINLESAWTGTDEERAAIQLNLSHLSAKEGSADQAAYYLREAMGRSSSYTSSAGCWSLLGDLEFRSGNYSASADAYSAALLIDPADTTARAWYTDALMFAGEFALAEEVYRARDLTDALSVVNRMALRAIRNHVDLDRQDRHTKPFSGAPGEAAAHLRKVDALDVAAWVALPPEETGMLERATLIARRALTVPHAWAVAALGAKLEGADSELEAIIDLALDNTGDDFIDALESFEAAVPEEVALAALIDQAEVRQRSRPRFDRRPITLFINGEPVDLRETG